MSKKRPKTRRNARNEGSNMPQLSNTDRGRLMAQTGASTRTVDAWWRGEKVGPITRNALDKAAKRLRMIVPATAPNERKAMARDSQRPPPAAEA